MSPINTERRNDTLHAMNGDRRDRAPFFGQTKIGGSTPIHVDHHHSQTPEAAGPPRETEIKTIDPGSRLDDLIDDYKLALVRQALSQSGGNHRKAAALIGIHRSSFTRMLHRLEGSALERQAAEAAQERDD